VNEAAVSRKTVKGQGYGPVDSTAADWTNERRIAVRRVKSVSRQNTSTTDRELPGFPEAVLSAIRVGERNNILARRPLSLSLDEPLSSSLDGVPLLLPSLLLQAYLRRRRVAPMPRKPSPSSARVAGSGT
jgi:hypothetical protein